MIVLERHYDNLDDHDTLGVTDSMKTAIRSMRTDMKSRDKDPSEYTMFTVDGNIRYLSSDEKEWYIIVNTELLEG